MHNKHNNSRPNFDNTYFDKNLTIKNKSVETPQFKATRKTPFDTDKKKVIVVSDSITKIFLHVRANDLTKGIITMKNIRKCVEAILELDNSENIHIGFSSIIHRSDKDFSKKISELNIRLNEYCLGRGFVYVDNGSINESCLNKQQTST